MIYIFDFLLSYYVYYPSCLFKSQWNFDIDEFFLKNKRLRDAVIDNDRQSKVNRIFLNIIYHLENTSMPCGPFCSSKFDVRD